MIRSLWCMRSLARIELIESRTDFSYRFDVRVGDGMIRCGTKFDAMWRTLPGGSDAGDGEPSILYVLEADEYKDEE